MSSGGGRQTITQTNQLDPWTRTRTDEAINHAQGIARTAIQPFYGPQIQSLDANQHWTAGADAIHQAAQTQQGAIAHALQQGTMLNAPNWLQGNLANYQNPYTQSVVDASLRDIDRSRQMALQGVGSQATGAGAFGGSRHALLEAETNRGYADVAARTAAGLRQQGFDSAMQNALADRGQMMQGLGQNVAIAGQGFLGGNQLTGLGQAQASNQMDRYNAAWQQYMNAQQYPILAMQPWLQALGQAPIANTMTTSQPIHRNPWGSALGGAATGASIGSAIPGIGTLIGAGIGGLGGLLFG